MELHSNSTSNKLSLSCFFCLRSNSRKYLNPQGESDSRENDEEAVASFHEFSLRNLYRFLDLLHSDKEEKDFRDLKMPICEDCFRLNGEFDKLYNLLEETKLRLNWCVKKMQDVMSKFRNESKLAFQVDIMIPTEVDVDEEDVLDIWRTHTLDRMKEVTRASFPQVVVYKRSHAHAALNDCVESESVGEKVATAKKFRTQENEADKSLTLSEKTIAPRETMRRSPSQPPSSSFLVDQTTFEENVSNNTHDSGNVIGTEMDCETNLVTPCRESSTIQEETKRKSHLRGKRRGKPALISNIVAVSNNIRMRAQFRCKACKAMINRMQAFEHWEHHCPAKGPQRPLISTIKKPSWKNQVAPSIKSSSKSSNCPYCSFKSSASASLSMERHIVRFHPEHYLIDEKDKAEGLWHDRFRSILTYMVYPHFVVNEGHHRSCAFCGTTSKCNLAAENLIMIKRHLLFHHKTELKEKLKVVLEDPLLEEKLDRSCNLKIRMTSRGTTNCSNKSNTSTSCTYCSFKSDSSMKGAMVSHIVRFHPEHYLIDENDRASGLWHEQFQTILGNTVYPNFITKVGRHRSCSSCGVLYKSGNVGENIFKVKKHLIFHHKAELKEKLKVVLEDPSLEEKLNGLKKKTATRTGRKTASATNNISSNCPYCRYKTISRVETMTAHLIRFHSEHFLIDKKDKASGLWHEHFRTILKEMVYPRFISSVGHGHRHHRSYSSCGIVYKSGRAVGNVVMMQRHLLFNHQTELKEKLKLVLGDPSLEGKLLLKRKNKSCVRTKCSKIEEKPKTKCSYCSFKSNSPAGITTASDSMVNHLVCFHPEHYLIDDDDRASGLWHEQFRTILMNMVYPHFISKVRHHRSCSLCGVLYKSANAAVNVIMMKRHLIFHHKVELKEKFKVALEDPSFEERLASCNVHKTKQRPGCRNNGKPMEGKRRSPRRISKRTTSTLNIKNATQFSLKTALEDPTLQQNLHGHDLKEKAHGIPKTRYCKTGREGKLASTCPYCPFKCGGGAYNRKNAIVKHLVQFHPEHFLLDERERNQVQAPEQFHELLTDVVLPKLVRKSGKHTSCLPCGMKYQSDCLRQNRISVRKHLIFNHRDLLKNELRNLDPGEKKEIWTNVQCIASTSRESQKPESDNYSSKCPYCRFKCDSPNILTLSMENHLVRFHPEHFLLEEDKSISKHPEFQRILSDMIFPKFLLITGQQTQCLLCDMKYAVGKRHENVVLLKKHLLLQHCAELRESIKDVMEDPTLEEKLDSCCADGVTCSCGVYFAPLEQQARRFHEDFHCIHSRKTEQSQEEKVKCSPHANNEMDRKQMEVDEKRSSGIFGLGEVDLLELD